MSVCPATEAHQSAYYIASFALIVPVLAVSSSPRTLACVAVLGFSVSGHQIYVCRMVTSFWAHAMFGVALLRGGISVLRGSSGLPEIPGAVATFAAVTFAAIIVGEVWTTRLGHFYSCVHVVIYLLGALLSLSAGTSSLARGRCAQRCAVRASDGGDAGASDEAGTAEAAAESVLRWRRVVDPAGYFGIGLLLTSHLHTTEPLPMLNHVYLGYMLQARSASECSRWLPMAIDSFRWLSMAL